MRQFFTSVIFSLAVFASLARCQSSIDYRLPRAVTPHRYDLFIQVNVDFYQFSGNVTIDIHVSEPVSTIQLHALELTIVGNNATIESAANGDRFESVYMLYNNESEIITIGLGRTLAADSNHSITLSFSGRVENDMKGLYMSSYYDRNVKYIATTFSAAAYARKIFPCFDEPHLKAVFRLRISCRDNFFALANTRVVSVEHEQDIFGTWDIAEFEPTVAMSTYLLAFTVSDFRNITSFEGLEFSVYANAKDYSNMRFALDVGRNALRALEEYTGIPYALDKMDFIAIDDFLMGAMENWGLISYKTSRIVNPVGRRNRRKVQSIITIITHELVHQWWGNLVTCEWWSYVWLNEGFASYIEYIIAEMILPDWRILEQFTIDDMHPVMVNDVQPKTHAMTRNVTTPAEIAKIYDFVAYPKAASVIRMVEHIMTPAIFHSALRLYLSERQFSSATEEQLFDALERTQRQHAPAENFPSIADVFRTWTQNAGYPILNVRRSQGERGKVHISQELFTPRINDTENSEFFILFNYAASHRASADYWLPEKSPWHWIHSGNISEIEIELDGVPEWVIFNLQQTGYYRVNYDDANWNAIIASLDSNTFHIIHVLNRAQLLDDSFSLARADYLDFRISLSMLKYLRREFELMPIAAGFKAIEFLLTRFDNRAFHANLLALMREIVDEIYMRVNDASHPEFPRAFSPDYLGVLQLRVNLFACRFGAPTCIRNARTNMFLRELTVSQPEVESRPHLYCGALHGDLGASHWTQLRLRLASITSSREIYRDHQEEISEILFALSSCDPEVARAELVLVNLFNSTVDNFLENITSEDATAVVGNLVRASTAHRELVMDFFFERYEIVNDTVPLTSVLSAFADAIYTREHWERLRELGIQLDVDVDDALAEIEHNILWSSVKVPEIEAWVVSERGAALRLSSDIISAVLLSCFALLALH